MVPRDPEARSATAGAQAAPRDAAACVEGDETPGGGGLRQARSDVIPAIRPTPYPRQVGAPTMA